MWLPSKPGSRDRTQAQNLSHSFECDHIKTVTPLTPKAIFFFCCFNCWRWFLLSSASASSLIWGDPCTSQKAQPGAVGHGLWGVNQTFLLGTRKFLWLNSFLFLGFSFYIAIPLLLSFQPPVHSERSSGHTPWCQQLRRHVVRFWEGRSEGVQERDIELNHPPRERFINIMGQYSGSPKTERLLYVSREKGRPYTMRRQV